MALTNLGREPLPWSAGHHFYFTLPWSEGTTRADYLIRIPATKRLRQDPTGALITGPTLQAEESIGNPALIDTLHGGLRSNEVVFGEKGRPGDVSVRLGTEKVPLTVRLPDVHRFEKHATIRLSISQEKLHLFDPETKKRLD